MALLAGLMALMLGSRESAEETRGKATETSDRKNRKRMFLNILSLCENEISLISHHPSSYLQIP